MKVDLITLGWVNFQPLKVGQNSTIIDTKRALPKGKPNKICEFGTKLSLNMSANGYITNHKLYDSNIADVNMLEFCVKEHKKVFGKKFKAAAAADRGYYDKDLISTLENKHKISLAYPIKRTETG